VGLILLRIFVGVKRGLHVAHPSGAPYSASLAPLAMVDRIKQFNQWAFLVNKIMI
jgi:hypothetical protein